MNIEKAQVALKKYFGYDEFRPMQAEIIESIYKKQDTLVLMPTGGGKSICFQIPAITMEGLCIVVSPLISLMKDQVESLTVNGIEAAYFNSSLSSEEQQAVEDDIYNNRLRLLYVSPEKLLSQSFLPLLMQCKVSLFAIDEAHCISSWGHDFRPEYTQMKFLKKQFPTVPIVALTATADKLTRKDIVQQLGIPEAKVFVASFDRPNLSLTVRNGQKRIEQILDFLREHPKQSGIIYCLSRKNTEKLSQKLNAKGFAASYYHAGLSAQERNAVQDKFINDQVPIVCATVAFGMGIDKSNVRWVIHYNLPKNMEGYYQEIGRAGRDGAKADTLLFYSFGDVMILRDILSQNQTDNTELKLSKLERMQEYADALICRRKILLNYFGENLAGECGNCDVCKNPPQYFDGTIIAQKALSAITRVDQRVGMRLLIDILRGSQRREIFHFGYNKIKTYGAGAEHSTADWQQFLMQLLQLGLVELAYDQNNTLKLTAASKAVLSGNKRIELVKMSSIQEHRKAKKKVVKTKTTRERVRDELFEILRVLRTKVAREKGVPPYIVFSDATLEEMAAKRPVTDADMNNISGVGERKLHLYGNLFMDAILSYLQDQSEKGNKIKGSTHSVTYALYKAGKSVEEIAETRSLTTITVYGHLADLYEKGEDIELQRYISKGEIKSVLDALQQLKEPYKLKDIFDYLKETIPYFKIKLALAYYYHNLETKS